MNIALLVGINQYPGNPLRGCLNDVENMRHLLVGLGWSPSIKTLLDHAAEKDRILDSLAQMISCAQEGDHLVFSFSGHGSQILDTGGDEQDGMDEIICPYGFDWETQFIGDDDLHEIISKLNADATLDVILDCCHSGTGLREVGDPVARFLPYPYPTSSSRGLWAYNPLLRELDQPNVALWAGCRSDQTSADALIDGKFRGAMTWAFCKSLSAGPAMSYPKAMSRERVHERLINILAKEYDQVPQLEACDEMKAKEIFT